ncbi:helix-turn-helix domain-containing protein [Mucilaginibacter sp. cycad4]|uniref:winged helix-turn-helix transcriptional regulator n=1 Tax=Mucilaginibacter sp. cycad4 TaxID=3342096 RepID=UPI002AAB5205|nr:helix-turn-helix domain-containing protein [Mucilaginibacter gossypii]WPU97887.1 helix-turn-helix domain-containing protein [Mucilaginibacter gossypii]
MENKVENNPCPVTATITLIGGRWKPIILFHLSDHTRRFGEIAVRMPSISRKVLSEQLKELEVDGLINRRQFKEIPPRVEYSLTELGKSVRPLLIHMATWGQEMILDKQLNDIG